ncbi:MAG: hypothetical protein KF915_17145 [Polyangiaceae bacterium]|nr:hypothetical protein [Polyangiaceae bacterium]
MELLPDFGVLRAVIARFAALTSERGDELGERPLVLPTGRYFPDEFSSDSKGATRVLRRAQEHAGLTDVPIRLAVFDAEEAASGGSCSSGGCGTSCATPTTGELTRVAPDGDGWLITLAAGELSHPIQLTSAIAVALGAIFLLETAEEDEPAPALDAASELSAVGLGFGVLLLEASYIYSKSCGGPRVTQLTRLSCGELAVATALFADLQGHRLRAALGELSTTQRATLKQASELLTSNPRVTELLRSAPEALVRGDFQLEDARPWLARVLARRRHSEPETLEEMEALVMAAGPRGSARAASTAVSTKKQTARRAPPDDLRALVEEALREEA